MRLLGLYKINRKSLNLNISDLANLIRTTKGIDRLRKIKVLLI